MSDRPLLVTGANGQLGRALAVALRGTDAVFWSRDEVDLADANALQDALNSTPCSAIINAAAYTAVDKAEEEEALATRVNGEAPGIMAAFCAQRNLPFIHYSTDYVFDGSGEQARREDELPKPLNAYGRSKLAGEQAVRQAGGDYLIFRTSWVYDAQGRNFLTAMLRLGREREQLRVVDDQIGAPSYAAHLAEASVTCLQAAWEMDAFPAGIYHISNQGQTSWHGFAEAIFEQARARGWPLSVTSIEPIPSCDYPTPAPRPLNSRLDNAKLADIFGVALPDWREGLRMCLEIMSRAG